MTPEEVRARFPATAHWITEPASGLTGTLCAVCEQPIQSGATITFIAPMWLLAVRSVHHAYRCCDPGWEVTPFPPIDAPKETS